MCAAARADIVVIVPAFLAHGYLATTVTFVKFAILPVIAVFAVTLPLAGACHEILLLGLTTELVCERRIRKQRIVSMLGADHDLRHRPRHVDLWT